MQVDLDAQEVFIPILSKLIPLKKLTTNSLDGFSVRKGLTISFKAHFDFNICANRFVIPAELSLHQPKSNWHSNALTLLQTSNVENIQEDVFLKLDKTQISMCGVKCEKTSAPNIFLCERNKENLRTQGSLACSRPLPIVNSLAARWPSSGQISPWVWSDSQWALGWLGKAKEVS